MMFLYKQETDSSLWSKLVEYPSFHCFLRQMRFPLELRSEEQNIAGPLRGEKEMQVIWPLNRLKHSLFFRRGHPWTRCAPDLSASLLGLSYSSHSDNSERPKELLAKRAHFHIKGLLACRPTRSVIEVPMTGSPRKLCLHQSRRARDYLE